MTTSLLLLAAALVLILANGFFVAAEFGLVTVERPAAERAAAAGDRRARSVVAALRKLSFQLSGTQLGITIASLGLGWIGEHTLTPLVAGWFGGLPAGIRLWTTHTVAVTLAFALITVLHKIGRASCRDRV